MTYLYHSNLFGDDQESSVQLKGEESRSFSRLQLNFSILPLASLFKYCTLVL